jgi:beta-lactam-binding protein with PASTA domain
VAGKTRPVPGCSSVKDCRTVLTHAGFAHTTVQVDSEKKAGDLVGTSPPRGARAVPGQVVSILVSNGADYVEPPQDPEPPVPGPAQPPDPEAAPGVTPPMTLRPQRGGGPRVIPGWPVPGSPAG